VTSRETSSLETGETLPGGAAPALQVPSIRRNMVFALLGQITTGVFTSVLMLYLVRALGPDRFGVFSLSVGIGQIAQLVADFGIVFSVARFVAASRGDHKLTIAFLADGLRLKLVAALVVAAALFALAGPIAAAYGNDALTWPLRGVAVSVFGTSIMALYLNVFMALARNALGLRVIFLESMVETGASIALVALGAGAAGAAIGRATGYLLGAGVATAIVIRIFGRAALRVVGGGRRTREIARYAVPLFVTNSGYTLFSQVDVLIIGALLGTTAVGVFSAPLQLVVPLSYIGQSVANSVSPRQAQGSDDQSSVMAFQTSVRWLVIYQSILLAPVIVWAEPIVRLLFGPEFHESANVLRLLSVFIFLRGLGPVITTTVNYLGRAARRVPVVLAALAVNTVIDLALLPWIGVVGAAIGTGVGYLIYVPAHFRICRQELHLPTRPLALTLLRSTGAAVVMAAVLLAVGTRSLSVADWLLGGAVGALVFGAALVVTGEISGSEIRRGRRAMMANVSRLVPFCLR
jgi:O-antigen/teichoic acid export membrane protein